MNDMFALPACRYRLDDVLPARATIRWNSAAVCARAADSVRTEFAIDEKDLDRFFEPYRLRFVSAARHLS
jgi:hypothetical protein